MAEAAVDNPVIVNMSGSAQYYLKYLPFLYLVRPDVYVMFDHVHNIVNSRFCDKQGWLIKVGTTVGTIQLDSTLRKVPSILLQ